MPDIRQAKILILATDGFEESELTVPQSKLSQAGATVTVAAPQSRQSKARSGGTRPTGGRTSRSIPIWSRSIRPPTTLVLPGGQINPDKLRLEPKALEVIKTFLTSGKVVAAICHAPWLLIEAGAAKGRDLTSFSSIRTDVVNAAAAGTTRRW